jgi:acyl dehydratase
MKGQSAKWRYFEDLSIGEIVQSDFVTMDRDEMVAFAAKYDPQYFHADEAAAADHPIFEGITASGIYVAAIWRLLDHQVFGDVAWVCGLGWDEVRWRKPLKPGDQVCAWAEILEKRSWKDKADVGRLTLRHELRRPDGEMVFGYFGDSLVHRRL